MRQAVVAAERRAVSITYELNTATEVLHAESTRGWVCAQILALHISLPEAETPVTPGAPIVDHVRRTERPGRAGFDTAGEIDGGGVLVVPNR